MPPTKTKTKANPAPGSIQINDKPREQAIRAVFKRRGLGSLSLSAMARVMIDEFTKDNTPTPASDAAPDA